jgi:hypothetical protein
VTTQFEFDCLTRPDLYQKKNVGTATGIDGVDRANQVHNPHVAVQVKHFSHGIADCELAVLLDGLSQHWPGRMSPCSRSWQDHLERHTSL